MLIFIFSLVYRRIFTAHNFTVFWRHSAVLINRSIRCFIKQRRRAHLNYVNKIIGVGCKVTGLGVDGAEMMWVLYSKLFDKGGTPKHDMTRTTFRWELIGSVVWSREKTWDSHKSYWEYIWERLHAKHISKTNQHRITTHRKQSFMINNPMKTTILVLFTTLSGGKFVELLHTLENMISIILSFQFYQLTSCILIYAVFAHTPV